MKRTILILLAASLIGAGCANMSSTEQRTLSGGAMGAGSGAVIGALAGSAALGAAAGGGAGLLAGFLYDQAQKSRQTSVAPTSYNRAPSSASNYGTPKKVTAPEPSAPDPDVM